MIFCGKYGVSIPRGKMLDATSGGRGLLSLLVSCAGGYTISRVLRAIRTPGREEKTYTLKLILPIWIWIALLSFGKYLFFHCLTICLCIHSIGNDPVHGSLMKIVPFSFLVRQVILIR